MFFNPRRHRVRSGILDSLRVFGHPRLEETADGMMVRVGDHEAQTLFAFDRDRRSHDPVGVVVFLRTSPVEIAIMHVAVHPDYALRAATAERAWELRCWNRSRRLPRESSVSGGLCFFTGVKWSSVFNA